MERLDQSPLQSRSSYQMVCRVGIGAFQFHLSVFNAFEIIAVLRLHRTALDLADVDFL